MNLKPDYKYWYDQYHTQDKSLGQLAEEHKTYPNKIRRLFIKLGIQLKDKSEAQKAALKEGRHKHPTRGTNRPRETKDKIGQTLANYWEAAPPEEREKRSERGKHQWEVMDPKEKVELQEKASAAMRVASKEGSKLEKYLRLQLVLIGGYGVQFHKTDLIASEKLHLDLYIPELMTAIEIDGPSHFLPIWGEESLEKTRAADNQKTFLLTSSGYNIIRVKHVAKSVSNHYMKTVLAEIIETLEFIRDSGPLPVEERLFWIGDVDE